MDIKNGGWEGHGRVTLIDPQEGKYERPNVNAVIAVCIQPHNLVFIAERWLRSKLPGSRRESDSGLQWAKRISIRMTAQPTRRSASSKENACGESVSNKSGTFNAKMYF